MSDELLVVSSPAPRVILGEGPFWHIRKQLLYWIDIRGKRLFITDPKKNHDSQVIELDQMIGCVVPAKGDELLLGLQNGIHSIDLTTKKITFIDDPESDKSQNRFNDGKTDPNGRFWAGTLELAEENPGGALYVMESDRKMKKVVDKVTVSNGLGWSLDHKTMYFIDSPTKKVDAFDYDLKTGTVSNRRKIIDIADGFPDGMTVDAEGMIWVCHWGGSRVTRWNPHTGELLRTVTMPVSKVTSCCFGGENLDILYITTASYEIDVTKEPQAGSLFVLKNPGVKGLETQLKEFAW
eukprot:TRINITY_DN3660_c0_g1_i1.p1 TRINITY_DN3660_c0_g1~~TRINITY_DN3660_c0_g1_i1.p1  ORF type:complete len:294 (+),score=55.80 TRINITY_DN3660_c0_g1_i1:82-963(+)